MHTRDSVSDITNSNKAIVFVDASSYGESILLGGKNIGLLTAYKTLEAHPSIEDGKAVVKDTFYSYNIEPLVIDPGRYSFMGYQMLNGRTTQIANIGGWTNIGRPLIAGFTVKAGDVIYLGHLNIGTNITPGQPENMVHLSIEDHSIQEGDDMRRQLVRKYPGAAEKLQTRLMEIYMPNVPVKRDIPGK